jgi:hypothetical protein
VEMETQSLLGCQQNAFRYVSFYFVVNETVNEIIFFCLLNEIVNETVFYFVVSNEMVFFISLSVSQYKIHKILCFILFYDKRNG